jgi:hypothetical protein
MTYWIFNICNANLSGSKMAYEVLCMAVKVQTVSVKARNMYVSYVNSLNYDTVFPNQNLGKLDKNSVMTCPHLLDYNEICNCLDGLPVVLNGIPDGG